MIRQLLEKWFGLEPVICATCEVLRSQLDESNRERRELLTRLFDKDKSEPPVTSMEEFQPIKPQFVPWRVRQQMLEAEDRKTAQLMKSKMEEIQQLEMEVGIDPSGGGEYASDVPRGKSGGLKFQVGSDAS